VRAFVYIARVHSRVVASLSVAEEDLCKNVRFMLSSIVFCVTRVFSSHYSDEGKSDRCFALF